MSPDQMRQFALESVDVSAGLVEGTSLADIDSEAMQAFREGVVAKAPAESLKRRYAGLPDLELLRTLRLCTPEGVLTHAALLLVGREDVLGREIPQAEIIFERRRTPTTIKYEVRHTVRRALLLSLDELMEVIMPYARLEPIEVRTGTRVTQLPRYAERSVREALLNAAAHRDYTLGDSVRVDMSPETFVTTSPGPFPADVTPENVAERSYWRNRLLAESLEKSGQIERSGQGVDLMMLASVQRAQPLPTFEQPEHRRVRVTLFGRSSESFLGFTQQVDQSVWDRLTIEDFRTLDATRRQAPVSGMDPVSVQRLIDLGLVQRAAGGHLRPGDRWLASLKEPEQRRLSLEGLKDRVAEAVKQNEPAGLSMRELEARFPDQSRYQLRQLLQEMRGVRVELRGKGRGARWHGLGAQL
jgi:ATP-dependent DNA helicase RecG